MTKVNKLFSMKNEIGEGPLWHPTEKCLYWIDITKGNLFKSDQSLSTYKKFHFDTMIGAVGFCRDGGLIMAEGRGFSMWNVLYAVSVSSDSTKLVLLPSATSLPPGSTISYNIRFSQEYIIKCDIL